jgi:VanZ family protein
MGIISAEQWRSLLPKKRLFVVAIIILAIIWGNSLLPAEVSGEISNWLAKILARIPGVTEIGAEEGLLRKLAHVLEFAALGVILALLRARLKKPWSLLLLAGVTVALIDETLQLFSPGRAGMVVDIWIDMGGFCLGILASRVGKHRG